MFTELTARLLITEEEEIPSPVVRLKDGMIESIEPDAAPDATGILTPAFFDIHVHGAVSHDFMSADQAGIVEVSRFLGGRGVAHYLPTTVSGSVDETLCALERLADAIERSASVLSPGNAVPVGIHLEGPFVSHVKRGVQPAAYLREPSLALFDRFQQAARGQICLLTLAPELPGALEMVRHAVGKGVRVSLGHSDADAAATEAAISAGASSATHTFNAMRALGHREPGILGTVLDSDSVYAEAICDGVHVHPALVRLWLKAKGSERAILITDGMAATGMPDGRYKLGDFPVEVHDGVCISGGALAGSVLTMDKAVANLMQFTGSRLGTAVRLASANPARMLGRSEVTSIAVGAPANFNVYRDDGERVATILRGHRVAAH